MLQTGPFRAALGLGKRDFSLGRGRSLGVRAMRGCLKAGTVPEKVLSAEGGR